jgi:hypothetical protein
MEYAREIARVSTLGVTLGELTGSGLGSGPPFPDTADLVAYWAFDGTSSTRAENETYKGYDRHGDSTWYSVGTQPQSLTPAYAGARAISGVDGFYTSGMFYYTDALHGPGSIDKFLFTSDFTIALWVYSPTGAISSWSNFIRVSNIAGNQDNFVLKMSNVPAMYFYVYDSVSGSSVAFTSPFSQNTYHHVLCEYDNATKVASVYLDGVKGTDGGAISTGPRISGEMLRCAEVWDSYSGSSQYRIDEISVWDRKMTAEEKSNLAAGVVLDP